MPKDQSAAEGRQDRIGTATLTMAAEICLRACEDLARQGYRPEGEKVLRRFTLAEIARYQFAMEAAELRAFLRDRPELPQGDGAGTGAGGGRADFSLDEIAAIRAALAAEGRAPGPLRPEGAEAKVLAVCNFKGGVAKTTTAGHLAMAAALDGLKVLVIDLDSQASMSTLFGRLAGDERETAYAVLAWDRARAAFERARAAGAADPAAAVDAGLRDYLALAPDDLVRPTHWAGVDLLAAQLNLYWAEFQVPVWLQQAPGWPFWAALGNFLRAGGLLERYDLVVIDTPPALGYLTINALAAGDILIVPTGASFIEFDSTGRFFDMLATTFASIEEALAGQAVPPRFTWDAVQVLLTRYDGAQQAELAALMEAYLGDLMAPHRQAFTALVGQAGERVSGIYEAAPGEFNRETYRRGRESFDAGWRAVRETLARAWGTDTGTDTGREDGR